MRGETTSRAVTMEKRVLQHQPLLPSNCVQNLYRGTGSRPLAHIRRSKNTGKFLEAHSYDLLDLRHTRIRKCEHRTGYLREDVLSRRYLSSEPEFAGPLPHTAWPALQSRNVFKKHGARLPLGGNGVRI
jgi:hypothetical protein